MSSGSTGVMQIGEWRVDPALDVIARGTEVRKLEPRTMRLLMRLAHAQGNVVSVETLLAEIWSGVVVGSASVYQAVSQLRKLLDDTDPEPIYIATVPRRGYRLVAPVRPVQQDAADGPARTAPEPAAAIAPPDIGVVAPPAAAPPVRRRPRVAIAGAAFMALLMAGAALWMRWPLMGRHAASMASIVVLPFVDMTADKSDQFFCDGLTEELSNWLSQIPTLKVVARTSAFAFRGQSEDVRKIGTALDTDHVLEGSIRRSGDHMRITVQLIDARNGYHLWSADYDRPKEDVIKIQEDISRSVAQNLQIRLTAESDRQFAARRTADGQAYDLYLLARHYTQLLTPDGVDRANELYRQVLGLDPNFAPAYVGLAWGILNRGYFRSLPTAETAAQMEPLITAALRIDAHFSGAYAARGALRSQQSRTSEALVDLQYALALNPSDLGAVAEIGLIRLRNGQPQAALQSYDRAAALDPLNHILQIQRCVALEDLARYAEATAACERARVLQPSDARVADALAWLADSRGRVVEALAWNAESIGDEPGDDFSFYWTRSRFFLSLGLSRPARQSVEQGRAATQNDSDADAASVRVVYCEGGPECAAQVPGRPPIWNSRPMPCRCSKPPMRRIAPRRWDGGEKRSSRGLSPHPIVNPARRKCRGMRGARARSQYVLPVDLAAADIALGDRGSADKELTDGARHDRCHDRRGRAAPRRL